MANGVTYNPEDAQTMLLINNAQRLCQTSMMVPIKDVGKKADKVHTRLDEFEDETRKRLGRLDDEKTGMVTQLWGDREAFMKMVRDFLMRGMILAAVLASIVAGAAAFVGIRLLPVQKAVDVKAVAQEVVKQMNKEVGP